MGGWGLSTISQPVRAAGLTFSDFYFYNLPRFLED